MILNLFTNLKFFNSKSLPLFEITDSIIVKPYLSTISHDLDVSEVMLSPVGFANSQTLNDLDDDNYYDFVLANIGLYVHNSIRSKEFRKSDAILNTLNDIEAVLLKNRENPWVLAISNHDYSNNTKPSYDVITNNLDIIDRAALDLTREKFIEVTKEITTTVTSKLVVDRQHHTDWFNSQV